MESDRARFRRDGRMSSPLRLLMTPAAAQQADAGLAEALGGRAHVVVNPGDDADIAFVSRDVTGLSTKHQVLPHTQQFHDACATRHRCAGCMRIRRAPTGPCTASCAHAAWK
jgi:hypothetical protein